MVTSPWGFHAFLSLFLLIIFAVLLRLSGGIYSIFVAFLASADALLALGDLKVVAKVCAVSQSVNSSVKVGEHSEAFIELILYLAFVAGSCLGFAELSGSVANFCCLDNIWGNAIGGRWAGLEAKAPYVESGVRDLAFIGPLDEEESHVHIAVTVLVYGEAVLGRDSLLESSEAVLVVGRNVLSGEIHTVDTGWDLWDGDFTLARGIWDRKGGSEELVLWQLISSVLEAIEGSVAVTLVPVGCAGVIRRSLGSKGLAEAFNVGDQLNH